MKTIDTTLTADEKSLLASFIGKLFNGYLCDEFHFNPSVYQMVAIYTDGKAYLLENTTREIDYFGQVDDVSVLTIKDAHDKPISSRIENGVLVSTPINQIIQDVILYEDTQIMSSKTADLYKYSYTKAIIFEFSDRKIVFERDAWFSEDIFIFRGRDAESKISGTEEDLESSEDYSFRGDRNIISLKESA